MSRPILVIGSSNVDFIMKMDRLPARDETVTNAQFMQTFGGKGANQAVAAGRAVGRPPAREVIFVNCVGDDPYAEAMLASYRQSGVCTDRIWREQGIASGTALVMIGEGGHNYLSVAPGANSRLTPARIDAVRELIAAAAYVLMQFEIPLESIVRVLAAARQAGTPVVWNYAPANPFDAALLGQVSIVVANEPEASRLTGMAVTDVESARAAAQRLRDLGAGTGIVTLGEQGSVVAAAEGVTHVPAFPVAAVDSTAAGDTYCGCLVVALAEGRPLLEAVRFASAGGALCARQLGAQPSIPWRDQIDQFLAAHSRPQGGGDLRAEA